MSKNASSEYPSLEGGSLSTSPMTGTERSGGHIRPSILLTVVILLTGLVFSGTLKLGWTNWDDPFYVYENPMVQNGDFQGIFTSATNYNYNPLPVAMFAVEWKLVQEEPWLYHLNNPWMHLLCTGLVFGLMRLLGLRPIWAAFAALMFGIHPLRVESVAWVTERKDVMFGTFFVGALIVYIRFLESKNWLLYGLCLVLFVLALFSKIQAVSLPLSLLAIDALRARKLDLRLFVEKVPFFIGSLIIGWVGLHFLQPAEGMDTELVFTGFERVALGMTAFCTYLIKAILPFETSPLYPYPEKVGIVHYLSIAGALAAVAMILLTWRRRRAIAFGMLFFVVNIGFVLQVVGVGSAYMADRFAYIPYLGLFFVVSLVTQSLVNRNGIAKWATLALSATALIGFAFLSIRYIPAWTDSERLWTHVIDHYPDRMMNPYDNRGSYRYDHKLGDLGFSDFSQAIALAPKHPLAYYYRGKISLGMQDLVSAKDDFDKAIALLGPAEEGKPVDPILPKALAGRGETYAKAGYLQEAMTDFSESLRLQPLDKNTWNARAMACLVSGDYPHAIEDFTQLLVLQPNAPIALSNRGVCFMRMSNWEAALADFTAALEYDPRNPAIFYNRAVVYRQLGNLPAALQDEQFARSLDQGRK